MYHIIVNPSSRSGKGVRLWNEEVKPLLEEKNIEYTPYFSSRAGDAIELAAEIVTDVSIPHPVNMIVMGGDGTVNEVFQGIAMSGMLSEVNIGFLPTGSSNDLVRDLKIPTNPCEALLLILEGKNLSPMDLGVITYADNTKRYFSVSCGIGFDAAVCEEAMNSKIKDALNKIGLGKLTYLGIALKQIFGAKAVKATLKLDGNETIDVNQIMFIAVMNHRFEGGGFMFCPDAIDNDGVLNLCVVGDLSKMKVLCALPTAYKGAHFKYKGITPYSAKHIEITTTTPLWVHTDGEVKRRSDSFSVDVLENAIKIYR